MLAAAVGALVLVATGRLDEFGTEVSVLRENPFDKLNEAFTSPEGQRAEQKAAWARFASQANSTCARYQENELVIRLALPRNRADYIRAPGIALERERSLQAELAVLKPPPNYDIAYVRFLHDRELGLAALERLPRAAKERNRKDFILAARANRAEEELHRSLRSVGWNAGLRLLSTA